MPRYDYRCEPCESVFEVSRGADERADVDCPGCGTTAKRVFSPVGVVFKGSGFHSTDYRTSEKPGPSAPCEKTCDGCPSASGGGD